VWPQCNGPGPRTRRPFTGAVLHSSREPGVRRPYSGFMEVLRRLINCRIIIIVVVCIIIIIIIIVTTSTNVLRIMCMVKSTVTGSELGSHAGPLVTYRVSWRNCRTIQ